jgi:hypothetical protein
MLKTKKKVHELYLNPYNFERRPSAEKKIYQKICHFSISKIQSKIITTATMIRD